MNRRSFLASTATAALGMAAQADSPKKIAAVVTEYRNNSHADVIIGKYLEGFRQNGQPPGHVPGSSRCTRLRFPRTT